jgi:hypothetical protein
MKIHCNIFHCQAWREIDVRITRYHVEACDNAKFLGAIEKSSHAIYLEVNCIFFWALLQRMQRIR